MADTIRCTNCKGNKYVLGVGCMKIDCPECKAVGWIGGTAKPAATKEISPSDVDQLRAELSLAMSERDQLRAENDALKEKLASDPKQKRGRKPKSSTGNKTFSPTMTQITY